MSKSKHRNIPILTEVEVPELTEAQTWAASVLSEDSPEVDVTAVATLFANASPASLPFAMMDAFLDVAQDQDQVRRGAMIIRRVIDRMWEIALADRGDILNFPQGDSPIKFNAMPSGFFNPRVI